MYQYCSYAMSQNKYDFKDDKGNHNDLQQKKKTWELDMQPNTCPHVWW